MTTLVRRSLHRARSSWRDGRVRSAIAAARLLRASRLGAVKAGVLAKEVAVLECRKGPDVSGLFSEFAAVLGFLDHFDRWRHLYAGVKVDFDDGLYYEPAFGPNWWEYYFEPIDIGGGRDAQASVVSPHYHDLCANRVERGMSRQTGSALIERYVAVKPSIRGITDAYVSEHWTDAFVVGIHYRGTDKAEDAPRVPYQEVEAMVRDRMSHAGPGRCRIFLATDEQAFVDYMRQRFPGQLLCREMFRSVDGRPIDVVNTDGNHKKGLDAVVDCLLLSRTHSLIRTASNLSLCSTFFNEQLPDTLLNPER
jgi:nodulation protein Z